MSGRSRLKGPLPGESGRLDAREGAVGHVRNSRTEGLRRHGHGHRKVADSFADTICTVGWPVKLQPRAFSTSTPTQVMLRRTASAVTPDVALWVILRNSAKQMSFDSYERFLRLVFCDDKTGYAGNAQSAVTTFRKILGKRFLLQRRRCLPAAEGGDRSVRDGQLRRQVRPGGDTYQTYDVTGAVARRFVQPGGCSDADPYEPAFTPAIARTSRTAWGCQARTSTSCGTPTPAR